MAADSGQLGSGDEGKKQEQQKRAQELRGLKQNSNQTSKRAGEASKKLGGAAGKAGGTAIGAGTGAAIGGAAGVLGGPGGIAAGAKAGAKTGAKIGGAVGKKAGEQVAKKTGEQLAKAPYRAAMAAKKQQLKKAQQEGGEAMGMEGEKGGPEDLIVKFIKKGATGARKRARKAVQRRAAFVSIGCLTLLVFGGLLFISIIYIPSIIVTAFFDDIFGTSDENAAQEQSVGEQPEPMNYDMMW